MERRPSSRFIRDATLDTVLLRKLPPGAVIIALEGEAPWTFEPGWDHITWRGLVHGEALARWDLPASPDYRWSLVYRPHAALLMLMNPEYGPMVMRWSSEKHGWSDPEPFVFKQMREEMAHGFDKHSTCRRG